MLVAWHIESHIHAYSEVYHIVYFFFMLSTSYYFIITTYHNHINHHQTARSGAWNRPPKTAASGPVLHASESLGVAKKNSLGRRFSSSALDPKKI
jgi:hypothetical protein